ncbi:MAG: hypothetical protein COT18_10335 [Elusimicrobia bacterium CG08_land_8_20_14_0_20_59_10]|nr:MAG: hypothetical protein COT18_10335 [Elusimicrobia bacterium CG08_land_8_20_14_0_20_59_10]
MKPETRGGVRAFRAVSAGAAFILFLTAAPAPAAEQPVNALLLVPSSSMAFDAKFQDFLNKNGARLLQSYPPSVFIGYIPASLDKKLAKTYGARVYRTKVDDWSSFARYGEKAVLAVNTWNKRFVDDPPVAPLIVSSRVRRAGSKSAGINLTWNQMMKVVSYRLQISPDEEFSSVELDTLLKPNSYRIFPAFWKEGVYYWRVSGLMTLNNGDTRESGFSRPDSFAVSRPPRPPSSARPDAPALPPEAKFTGPALRWESTGKYYRLQLSLTGDFSAPVADVFTDTCSYKAAGLPITAGVDYYMRVLPSDGWVSGEWSPVSKITVQPAARAARAARGRRKR